MPIRGRTRTRPPRGRGDAPDTSRVSHDDPTDAAADVPHDAFAAAAGFARVDPLAGESPPPDPAAAAAGLILSGLSADRDPRRLGRPPGPCPGRSRSPRSKTPATASGRPRTSTPNARSARPSPGCGRSSPRRRRRGRPDGPGRPQRTEPTAGPARRGRPAEGAGRRGGGSIPSGWPRPRPTWTRWDWPPRGPTCPNWPGWPPWPWRRRPPRHRPKKTPKPGA